MAWSNSKIFAAFVKDVMDRTSTFDIDTDTVKAALYNNTGTPDNTVSSANSAYNAGQWVTGNEVSNSTNWTAGGIAITTKAVTASTTTIKFDGDDTPSATSTATLANVYGCLVYDDTLTTPVADPGICYNYFGGVQSVTSGSFTIVWNASGIFTISVA